MVAASAATVNTAAAAAKLGTSSAFTRYRSAASIAVAPMAMGIPVRREMPLECPIDDDDVFVRHSARRPPARRLPGIRVVYIDVVNGENPRNSPAVTRRATGQEPTQNV